MRTKPRKDDSDLPMIATTDISFRFPDWLSAFQTESARRSGRTPRGFHSSMRTPAFVPNAVHTSPVEGAHVAFRKVSTGSRVLEAGFLRSAPTLSPARDQNTTLASI